MSGKRASIAAGVAGLLAIGGVSAAAASAATATPATTPHWHIVNADREAGLVAAADPAA